FDIKLGDSIRQSIDKGLSKSRFGIAVISHAFIKKKWTQYELNGLLAREMSGAKTVLPVWYDINREDVMMYSQSIADKLAVIGTSENVEEVASEIAEILRTNQ
ncbi:MAG: TIR domain-containing protein, partial [Desulfobacterales bacterium]|nr:TIR domain-containing protein [Desulfobacterales bacterium]